MPYATDTVKATVRGTIAGVQSWSTGFWFATANFDPLDAYGQAQLDGLRDSSDLQGYWGTWWASLSGIASALTNFTNVEYSLYEGASRAAKAVSVWTPGTPFSGGGGVSMPPECAICVTMQTADPGGSGRGRSYFPHLGGTLDGTTGGLTLTNAQAVATAYGILLADIAAHDFDAELPGPTTYNLVPSLASFLKGTNHPLTKVGVDTRVDSQRRREHKLPTQKAWTSL
jgi:hypothetical protein